MSHRCRWSRQSSFLLIDDRGRRARGTLEQPGLQRVCNVRLCPPTRAEGEFDHTDPLRTRVRRRLWEVVGLDDLGGPAEKGI